MANRIWVLGATDPEMDAIETLLTECADTIALGSATGCDESHGYDSAAPGYYGPTAADMRGRHTPELPEAGTRLGISYVADGLPTPDGRTKVVCSGTPDVVRAFMRTWAPANGLTGIYGDPVRGFAGGYVAAAS